MAQIQLFNDQWEFLNTDLDTDLSAARNKEGWKSVDLPHDWLIYDSNHLYENGMGFYRKHFQLEKIPGRQYFVRFEAIYQDSAIYMNGAKVGEWKYGYNTFEVEVTDALVSGDNLLEVSVRYESPNSRWYSGAGIFRDVYWVDKAETHLVTDGIYLRTRACDGGYELRVSAEVKATEAFSLCYQVLDVDGNTLQAITTDRGDTVTMKLEGVHEWSLEDTYLYTLKTMLLTAEGVAVDAEEQRFGFRTLDFTTDRGLLLNGSHVKINGVCVHHDLGALGAAFSKPALRRQLSKMKEMGVNGLRTSHNMPARELLELADEMGFLVDDEMFDMWKLHKTEHDYATWFEEWAPRDIANFVRRDRNHASLLMWSVGNEIYDTQADPEEGLRIIRMLRDETMRHDPEQNGRVTFASNFMEGESTQQCAQELGVVGYNYLERLYEAHHEKYPDWVIYGSETASTVQSRGIYHFPYEEQLLADVDEQCSSLGNSTTSWGADNTEACIIAERDTDYSLGQFIWTGYDYIGEPTPYQTKNSYFGQVDTAGFEKDAFYIYQSAWTDYKTHPMVHVFPYWDFNPGQMIDLRVASNAPEIELLVNGVSQGCRQIDHAKGKELLGHWKLPYEEGSIEAIAYDENHVKIARQVRRSFGDAVAITSKTESCSAYADGRDLYFIEIGMVDAAGNPVENANNRVKVSVEGPGRLVGLDNGDSTDYESYKGNSRCLFSGKLLAMIATTQKAGYIVVTISSEGMQDHKVYLTAEDAPKILGVSCQTENCDTVVEKDIPIRKIEITSAHGLQMNEEIRSIELTANLLPANNTHAEDLTWMVINDAGVETNLAKITAEGNKAVLTAMGDGHVNVRCFTRNGRQKVSVISQLGVDIEGIGSAYLNPYEFVSASLHDVSEGDLQRSLDHGIATDRNKESYIGFTNVDFGDFGSDRITIPCFAFSSCKDYRIRIWSGVPGEADSECLVDGIYNKETIWDTYIPETYQLPHRLKGIQTLCIQTDEFINIKGFYFEPVNKGTAQVFAVENNSIYGDEFEVREDMIHNIGNNVSIEFCQMDFREGVHSITICGHSPIDKNSIHIRFTAEDETFTRQMIEFVKNDGNEEQTFTLEPVAGLQKVTFIFLPGSKFDMCWFRFQ